MSSNQQRKAGTRTTLENQVTEGLSKAQGDQVTPPAAEKTDQGADGRPEATEGQGEANKKVIFRSNPTKVAMRTYIVEFHWSGTCFHQHFQASDPAGLLNYVGRVLGGQDVKILLDYDPLELAAEGEEAEDAK